MGAMSGSRLSRRQLLSAGACGFGSLALQGMLAPGAGAHQSSRLSGPRLPMFPARAKRVIFVFMQGGPSHLETFDHKPELAARDGQSIEFTGVRFGTFGKVSSRRLMGPLWRFAPHGQCGRMVSELFPHQARIVDDLCFVHSMHTEGVAHGPATLFLHTGATNLVRPSMGSWIQYGLGSINQDLPGFVTLGPSPSNGGPRNYSSAFLPSIHQGTALGLAGTPMAETRFRHLEGIGSGAEQQRRLELVRSLDAAQLDRAGEDDRLEAEIEALELAFRMQAEAPQVLDLGSESEETLGLYGIGEKETDEFGRQCLMARRLSEAGVRFVQVNYADESPNPRWDQHENMPLHARHARATDKPVAGLVRDLKRRGLLEDTLVWWGGEFGRTPFAQGKNGRDHNPRGFTTWLAGGGVKAGFALGATDEIGHHAVTDRVHMHDLHATILHLLGLDHERLTFAHAGRDFRLTDVHGRVVRELLA